jgi:hypothetical protein
LRCGLYERHHEGENRNRRHFQGDAADVIGHLGPI